MSNPETGALHLHLNTGKRSIVGSVGDELVDRLIAGADIVLQSSADLDPDTIEDTHPGLSAGHHYVVWGMNRPYAGCQR